MSQKQRDQARALLAQRRDATDTALQALADADAVLARAERLGKEVDAARAARDARAKALVVAQGQESEARDGLQAEIAGHLSVLPQPGGEIAQLATTYPIVLFPVRIETRFDLRPEPEPSFLRVRVYPDAIFADDLEERLTKAEEVGGLAYWSAVLEGRDDKPLWDQLATRFGPQRAAWIVKATRRFRDQEPQDAERDRGPYRPDSWNRAVEARLLPDRWLIVAHPIEGGPAVVVAGAAIREPLAMTFDPNDPGDQGEDDELLWTVDYERAKQVGMALDVPLASGRGRNGFSQLLVLGVKSTLTARQATDGLRRLLAAHRFGRGLAFVRQGTPTNSTRERPSGYPNATASDDIYAVEVAATREDLPARSDARKLLQLLGIDDSDDPYETWRLLVTRGQEQRAAQNMNRVLWPATWGYYLQHMMARKNGDSLLSDDAIAAAKSHFIDHVRGRGPLPAIRVGNTPYGLLPVSSLDAWVPSASPGSLEAELPQLLRRLRNEVRPALADLPRINRDPSKPDADLVRILGQHPSTREVRVRSVVGESVWFNLLWLLRQSWLPWTEAQKQRAQDRFARIGRADWWPRVARSVPWGCTPRYGEPLVGTEPLSEEDGPASTDFDYVSFLATGHPFQVLADEAYFDENVAGEHRPRNLLYRVLRHAMLIEYVRLAWRWVEANRQPGSFGFFELIRKAQRFKSIWRWMVDIVDIDNPIRLVDSLHGDKPLPGRGEVKPPTEHRDALKELALLPDAELERLFSETLDLCSHRIDGWITSIFSRRLHEIRTRIIIE